MWEPLRLGHGTEAEDAGRLLQDGEGAAVIGPLAEAVQAALLALLALLAVSAVCLLAPSTARLARAGRMLHVAWCMLQLHIASHRIASPMCKRDGIGPAFETLFSRGIRRSAFSPEKLRPGQRQRLVEARTGREAYSSSTSVFAPPPTTSCYRAGTATARLSLDSFLSSGGWHVIEVAKCGGPRIRSASRVACHVRRLGRLARSRRMSCKSPPSAIRPPPAASLSGALVCLAVCSM
jgi:hypothetical protein